VIEHIIGVWKKYENFYKLIELVGITNSLMEHYKIFFIKYCLFHDIIVIVKSIIF
jgi:hypothetical protein